MLRLVAEFLAVQSRPRLILIVLVLVALVGVLDDLTGYELSFSIFYLIPVAIGAWYGGRRVGVAIALLSAVVWFGVDYGEHAYRHPSIPYWNAAVRSGFFLIVAMILARLRDALAGQASLAQRDGLTGLLNMRAFMQRCDSLVGLASRHGHPLAIGYLDLDGFKGVNDKLGHGAGDQLLKQVAAELSARLRAEDVIGRLGGDEFAVLLPETDLGGARTLFTDVHRGLQTFAAEQGWPVGFSIGVAVFTAPTANLASAIRQADTLMYRVKRSGKNSILFEEYAEQAPAGLSAGADIERLGEEAPL